MSKIVSYIKDTEFNQLMSKEKNKNFKLAYLFAFGSGLRISEIVGYKRKDGKEILPLSKENIDLTAKTIRIIGGKGLKDRVVPLFPNFKEDYLKMLPLEIKRITLQVHFSTLCKKTLRKNYSFHCLRHSFAIYSIKRGVKLPFLQLALGHSRLDTTGRYLISEPSDMLEDYKKSWGEI